MAELATWLERIGLGHYADAFAEAAIDLDVLPDLSEADLADLGVKLGDRKRLLKAIAALGHDPERPVDAPAEVGPGAPTTAERRQLTVMFIDLVGSTGLSQRLDPEDMGEVMRAYHARATEIVRRWGGHVAKYLGDGVLAYFGWPQAHEDDAERAVRAGLALSEAVPGLEDGAGEKLAIRVGIATGPVVVGELIGEGAAQEQAVVGETPNLAARLQALAQPGAVVISKTTRRLLGGLFELADLGPRRLRGFAEPLAVWRVEREAAAESRFEATRGRRLTPLVGREHELGLLLDRWSRAKDGEGQVVLLSGEPGIGKSRLIQALRERLRDQPHTPLPHYGSPHHTNSAFYPVVRHLERAAGFERDDSPEVRLDKLEALLTLSSEGLDDVVPLLAALLGISVGPRYSPLDLTPQRQKHRTLEVLVDQVAGLAAKKPVLALYEDVHWVDPTTLEALGLLIGRVQDLPVLVVITCRPEFSPPWRGHAHLMRLSLTRLSRGQDAALVERITRGKVLPPEVIDQIVAKTEGVPLFVEELTKAVLEGGFLRRADDRYELVGPLPPFAIPSSLHDSLMARLDRLGVVKEVAQTAAVIGREFSLELLAAVAERSEPALHDALDQLVQSGLVFRRGSALNTLYSFKHALVRDAAYHSFLRSKRLKLHARIAEALKTQCPETSGTQPELIAHHYTEAGLAERAIVFWRRAAEHAIHKSANLEAVGHFQKALELLASLPQSGGRDRDELELQLGLGAALIAPKSYAAEEIRAAFARAEELSRGMSNQGQHFRALRGLWNWHLLRANLEEATRLADLLSNLSEQVGEPAGQLMAHRVAGTTRSGLGRLRAANEHFAQGLNLYDPTAQDSYVLMYGEDPGLFCYIYSAQSYDCLGYRDQALNHLKQALMTARSLPHRYSLTFVLALAAFVYLNRRELEETRRSAEEAIVVSREQGVAQWLAMANVYHGWAVAAGGNVEEGLRQAYGGFQAWRSLQCLYAQPNHLTLIADIHRMSGAHQAGLQCLDEAGAIIRSTGYVQWASEVHRLRGDLLILRSCLVEAEEDLKKAIKIAGSQHARTFQLRAATSLARLWGEQGRRTEAHDLLAPVYGWFTEGFDTRDLKDAKALLDQLA